MCAIGCNKDGDAITCQQPLFQISEFRDLEASERDRDRARELNLALVTEAPQPRSRTSDSNSTSCKSQHYRCYMHTTNSSWLESAYMQTGGPVRSSCLSTWTASNCRAWRRSIAYAGTKKAPMTCGMGFDELTSPTLCQGPELNIPLGQSLVQHSTYAQP
jgi:hypothetical protein